MTAASKHKTRIYINGRFLEQPLTGVQRYTRELLKNLDLLISSGEIILPNDLEIICLAPISINEDPAWKNIQLQKVGKLKHNLWEQIELPFYARNGLLFSPANIGPYFGRNQIVTIHDASVFAVPEAYSFSFRLKYKVILRKLAKTAKRIFTDSEYSRKEIYRFLSADPENITVIPLGHEHLLETKPVSDYLQKNEIGKKPYFLCVGSSSAHKNLKIVFEAAKKIQRDDFEIIIAGGNFSKVFQGEEIVELPNIRYLGYVNDSELCTLYKSAKTFIFPSKYEGFGFPILESLSFGCPVITTREASIPEVGRDIVSYFDWNDAQQLVELMNKTLDNQIPSLEEKIIKAHLSLFTWKRCALKTFNVIINQVVE